MITLSDGQTLDPTRIMRATLFTTDEAHLLMELKDGTTIKVFGPGVRADAALLNTVRDEQGLNFLVFE